MKSALVVIARILGAILYAINSKKKSDALDNPADTIAGGGSVQQSDETFDSISRKSERDTTK